MRVFRIEAALILLVGVAAIPSTLSTSEASDVYGGQEGACKV
jgi:hypothetical protein